MAYSKNRIAFRNSRVLDERRVQEDRMYFENFYKYKESINDEIEVLINKEVSLKEEYSRKPYIEAFFKILDIEPGLKDEAVKEITVNDIEKIINDPVDIGKFKSTKMFLERELSKISEPYKQKMANNELNKFLINSFERKDVLTNKDTIRMKFNKPYTNNTSKYNPTRGIEVIDRFGYDLVEIMSPGATKNTAREIMNKSIENVEKTMILTGSQLGKSNQSLHSIEAARKNLEQTGRLVVFDLETFGGKDSSIGAEVFDRITEISFKDINTKTGKEINNSALLGIDKITMNKYLNRIDSAMKNGTFEMNSDLAVIASRLAKYGEADIVKHADGLVTVENFPGEDFDTNKYTNMDAIKKGASKLVEAYEHSQNNLITTNEGIKIDAGTKMLIDNAKKLQDIFVSGNGVVAGYNHMEFDIPFLNSQMQSLYSTGNQNVVAYIDKVFGKGASLSLDPSTIGKGKNAKKTVLDMLSVTELANKAYGTEAIYGYDYDMISKVKGTPNRQEFIGAYYLKENPLFTNSAEAHKAEFDTSVLKELILGKIENTELRKDMKIPDSFTGSTLDYLMDHITTNGYRADGGTLKRGRKTIFDPTKKDNYYFMLNRTDRASSSKFRGRHHLDFSYDIETGEFHFANDATNLEQGANKVVSNSFYKSMRKDAIYQISNIKKINPTDEFISTINDLYTEYGSGQLYALEFKTVLDPEHVGTDIERRRFVKIFNTFDEMEGFLSTQMDTVAEKTPKGIKVRGPHKDKLILRTIDDGKPIIDPDEFKDEEALFNYIKNVNTKIEKDNARRYLLDEEKSYSRIKDMINFSNKIEADEDLKKLSKVELSKKYSEAIINATNGNPIEPISQNLLNLMKETIGYQDIKTKEQRLYRSTAYNAINSLEFLKENGFILSKVLEAVDAVTLTENKEHFLSGHNKRTASDILKNVLNEIVLDNAGDGLNTVYTEQQLKNTFDVRIKGIYNRRNTKSIQGLIPNEEDIITITNLNDNNAKYNLLSSMKKAYFSNMDIDRMSTEEKENVDRLLIQKFFKDSDYQNLSELKSEVNLSGKFNPNVVAEKIIHSMRKLKKEDSNAGLIKFRTISGIENLNPETINVKEVEDRLLKDPDYIKKIAEKYKNIKIIDTNNMSSDLDLITKSLIKFDKDAIKNSVISHYGNVSDGIGKIELDSKNILYNNAFNDIRNVVADLMMSSHQAGAELNFNQKAGTFSLKKGNQLVEVNVPKLEMHKNGMMYIRYGNQNIKLNHKFKTEKDGTVRVTSSIDDLYGYSIKDNSIIYKNQIKVRKAIEEGTFELEQINQWFRRDLNKLSENSKMVTINAGDYYSNLTIDSKDFINKVAYAIFSDKNDDDHQYPKLKSFKEKIKSSELYGENKEFYEEFKRRFGGMLNDEKMAPDALLFMARESPLMLRALLNEVGGDDLVQSFNVIANALNIASKKQETEKGIYGLGEQRHNVIASDAFNNNSRPVSGGSGNFIFTKRNSDYESINGIEANDFFKGSLLATEHTEQLNNLIENGEEYASHTRIRTLYTGDIGLDAIFRYQFESVIKENNVEDNIEKQNIANMFAKIRANYSVFEQQKIMDPVAFEKSFGSNIPADIKYFSSGLDLIGSIIDEKEKNIDDRTIAMKERLAKVMPSISVDDQTGNVIFKSGVGQLVTRDDKVFSHKSFAGIIESMNSNLRTGVLDFFVQSSNGIDMSEEEISKILSKYYDEFENVDSKDVRSLAISILEREGYSVRFGIKDINKITLPKLNVGSGEKSMSSIIYSKTGSINKDIEEVFADIEFGLFHNKTTLTKNTVLYKDSFDAIMNRYIDEVGAADLQWTLRKFDGDTLNQQIDNLWNSIREEQMSYRNLLFGHGKLKDIFSISNDAPEKHGNIGLLMENNLANAITLLGKYKGNGEVTEKSYNEALQFVVDTVNSNENFAFLKNEEIFGLNEETDLSKKVTPLKLRIGKHNNLMIDDMRYTSNIHTLIDGNAYKNLIERIDSEIEKINPQRPEEDKLITNKFFKVNTENGQVELVETPHYGQALFIKNEKKQSVITGTVVEDIVSMARDPETQTDVDYRYIEGKRKIIEIQNKQKTLLEEIRELRQKDYETDEEEYAARNNIKNKRNEYRQNRRNIKELKQQISEYKVKPIKYTALEERLLLSHRFDEAIVNSVNSANAEAGFDLVKEYAPEGLNDILTKNSKTGEYVLDIKDDRISTKVFDQFTKKMIDSVTFKPGEEELTLKMVREKDEYAKYKDIYERVTGDGRRISVEAAEKIYDLERAKFAVDFNETGANRSKYINPEEMIDKGFRLLNIDEVPFNQIKGRYNAVDTTIDDNIIIDLGTMFSDSDRYIAVPGLGKFIGEDDEAEAIRQQYQSNVNILKARYNDLKKFPNTEDAQLKVGDKILKRKDVYEDVLQAANDVKTTLNLNLKSKKGAMTEYENAEIPSVSARQKITGIGYVPKAERDFINGFGNDQSILEERLRTESAMAKAKINGKSLLELEEAGIHYDYAFVSEDVLRSMGMLTGDTARRLGVSSKEELIEKLETEGIDMLTIRYPGIYDSSLVNTKVFLDRTTGNNAIKLAQHTMRKVNGDVDGDSASFMMLESKNYMNSLIYSSFKERAKGWTQEELEEELSKAGYSYKDDYLLFKKAESKAYLDAITENKVWREDARSIRLKDYNKNIKSSIDMLSSKDHRIKVTDVVKEDELKHVDNIINNMFSDVVTTLTKLENENPSLISSKSFASKYSNIKELSNASSLSVKNLKNPTMLINESLEFLKEYTDSKDMSPFELQEMGTLLSDQGNYKIASDIRKMFNESFIEQNNKTGAPAIGSVNVKLTPLRMASRQVFSDGTDESTRKDNVIQGIAAKVEQNAINFKKQEAVGNQSAVPDINEALHDFMDTNNEDLGRQKLRTWFDNVSGEDAFADIYDKNLKTYTKEEQEFLSRQIKERAAKNNTSESVEKSKEVVEKFFSSLNELKTANVDMTTSYRKNPIGKGSVDFSGETQVTLMERGMSSLVHNDVFGKDIHERLENAREAQRIYAKRVKETNSFMGEITASSIERPVSSLINEGAGTVKRLMGHRSSGLAMGVIGLASGIMLSGFASGNPLQQDQSPYLSNSSSSQPQSIPEFFDQEGGYAQQSNNGGYIINVRADTKQGKKQLERTMKKVAKQGFGNVSVNMSIRDKNKPKSNQDIENWIASNL